MTDCPLSKCQSLGKKRINKIVKKLKWYIYFIGWPLVLSDGCSDGQWQCQDNTQRCIDLRHVCDNIIHCQTGSDEDPSFCAQLNCTTDQWRCKNNKCIDRYSVCTGYAQCQDGSDEDPDMCADWSCQEDQWKCQNNRCISLTNVCDGGKYKETDCEDRSEEDEELCMNWNCSRGMWKEVTEIINTTIQPNKTNCYSSSPSRKSFTQRQYIQKTLSNRTLFTI